MPRRSPAHAVADRFEPRLARAIRRSIERIRTGVSINSLAMALSGRDVKGALAMLPVATVKDALAPAGTIVRDATLRGGRLAADQINEAA